MTKFEFYGLCFSQLCLGISIFYLNRRINNLSKITETQINTHFNIAYELISEQDRLTETIIHELAKIKNKINAIKNDIFILKYPNELEDKIKNDTN